MVLFSCSVPKLASPSSTQQITFDVIIDYRLRVCEKRRPCERVRRVCKKKEENERKEECVTEKCERAREKEKCVRMETGSTHNTGLLKPQLQRKGNGYV